MAGPSRKTSTDGRVHRFVYVENPVDGGKSIDGAGPNGGPLNPGQGVWFGPEGGTASDGTRTDGTIADWAKELIRNPMVFQPDEDSFLPGTEENPTPGPGQSTFVDTSSIDVEAQSNQARLRDNPPA